MKSVLIISYWYFTKHVWTVPLKDTEVLQLLTRSNIFQKESCFKSSKTWVDKGSEFYNRSIKSELQNNDTEIYLTNI